MTNAIAQTFQELLNTATPAPLGPGPRQGVKSQAELERALTAAFATKPVSAANQELIRSLVLLWHDHLDESHTISQSIENPDGSLLHAIMHRREPDYWNSKYWWRRVGRHACFAELGQRVARYLDSQSASALGDTLAPRGQWNPDAFVDACEAAADDAPDSERPRLLREVQRIETEVALAHFLRT